MQRSVRQLNFVVNPIILVKLLQVTFTSWDTEAGYVYQLRYYSLHVNGLGVENCDLKNLLFRPSPGACR